MSPAARLSLPARRNQSVSLATTLAPTKFRVQGWDPVLIISQIVAFQAIHYLTLALILPIFLSLLSNPPLLEYEGGPSSISLAMDWRSFTGRTVSGIPTSSSKGLVEGLSNLDVVASTLTGKLVGGATVEGAKKLSFELVDKEQLARGVVRIVEWDRMRGWAVAFSWFLTSLIDIFYIYHFIRRPTHILDFSLTLLFNHTILTTYYSHSFPSSFFYWTTLTISVIVQIVVSEQMCVKREMREGFSVGEMTPHLGATVNLPPVPGISNGGGGGGTGKFKGRTPSLSTILPRDRFSNVMEMGNVANNSTGAGGGGLQSSGSSTNSGSSSGKTTKSSGGKEYERLSTNDR